MRASSQVQCPSIVLLTRNTRFKNKRLFASESSKPCVPMSFRCIVGLEKFIIVSESIIIRQTNKIVLSPRIFFLGCRTRLHCVCLFGILLTQRRSDSHSQVAGCETHLVLRTCSGSICQLCPHHISDSLLLECFTYMRLCAVPSKCAPTDVVVSQFQGVSFVLPSHGHHD